MFRILYSGGALLIPFISYFERAYKQCYPGIFLRTRGYYPGRWYRPALFPGVKDYDLYNLDPELSDLPNTKRLIESAVNLPTQESIPRAQEIVSLVNQWADDNC